MKVSIHQPQYLPWLPYFLKIKQADIFIFLDSVDFQKNGLQNRNKIKTSQGDQWLTVPVKHSLGQKILDIEINNNINWRKKHWQAIKQSYGKSDYFDVFSNELKNFYDNNWILLSKMNIELTLLMMKMLNFETKIILSSDMKVQGSSSDLILSLCKEVSGTTYISGLGGKNYLIEKDFFKSGINIEYFTPNLPTTYPQNYHKLGYIDHLSAVDILLNCGETWESYIK